MSNDGMRGENLSNWQQWLMGLENGEVSQMKSRILRTAGLRVLEHVHDLTPVRHSRLVNSMSMGAQENVFRVKIGRESFVFVGTAVPYAQYVNDGYQQRKGQFVPGYWEGDEFVYVQGYSGGMVLTGKLIPGAHMFDKAMDRMQTELPQITEFELRRLYQRLFS